MYNLKNFYLPLAFSAVIILIFTLINPNTKYNSKSSFTENIDTAKDLTFYVASDIHYLSKSLRDTGNAFNKFYKNGDGKQLNYINEIFDSFVNDVKINNPNFIILSGDLTLNGEKKSHEELSTKLQSIKNSGINIYVIPGNHDINNPWAREFKKDKQIKTDYISDKEFAKIYNNFGFSEAISKDESTLSYLVAPSDKLWLLMLDDNKYKDNVSSNYPNPSGFIPKSTLQWIKSCGKLAKENSAKIIVVSHHNILKHSDEVYEGFTLDNNNNVIKALKSAEINLALSGHIHFQSIKEYKNRNYTLNEIATSSLATYPQKYGIINLSVNNELSYTTNTTKVIGFSCNFKDYSKKYFMDFIYNQNFNQLSFIDTYTNDEINSMCETICNIRLKYDDSLDDLSWDDITSSNGFKLLYSYNSPFFKHYINLALSGDEIKNNLLNINL